VLQLTGAMSGMFTHSPVFLVIAGIASILMGIVLFTSSPVAALLALVWVIGLYALVDGCMLIARSFHFRSLGEKARYQHRDPEFIQ
jgi:uncharacterized membrane protein HdeD (DUF308 family)